VGRRNGDATFYRDGDWPAGDRREPVTSLFSGAPDGEVAPTQNSFGSTLSISQLFTSGATASVWTSASREGTNGAFTLFQPAYFASLGVACGSPCSGIAPSIPPAQPSV
jgi:hypothetical protein